METLSSVRDVPCRIIPRSTLSSAELQRLGQALDEWSQRELPEGGLLSSIDAIAVFDKVDQQVEYLRFDRNWCRAAVQLASLDIKPMIVKEKLHFEVPASRRLND